MIWESEYWKKDLLEKAANLRKPRYGSKETERGLAKLEQLVMLGFYSIRKLHEASKLSDATLSQKLDLISYAWSGRNVTKLNWHHVEVLYKLDSPTSESHDVLFLCHQFVHSYIFMTDYNGRNRLDRILFASDRQRHKALLAISIAQVASLFDQAGRDYPSGRRSTFNPKKLDYDIVCI